MIHLSTFKPLCRNRAGRDAVARHGLPRFVDASCRREPDLEHERPSISCVCHGDKFAPRLREGDTVVYITTPGRYTGAEQAHWRLVAIRGVTHRFGCHGEAAAWYKEHGYTLPSNCLVEGNPPLPLDHTDQSHDSVAAWDRFYHQRVRKCGAFLTCLARHVNLREPPAITEAMIKSVFGRIPATRTPPRISEEVLHDLLRWSDLDIGVAAGCPARDAVPAAGGTNDGLRPAGAGTDRSECVRNQSEDRD